MTLLSNGRQAPEPEPTKNALRPYVVLVQVQLGLESGFPDPLTVWEQVGDTHDGSSARDAIKRMIEAAGVEPNGETTYVAIPARSWQPATPKPRTGLGWA